MALMNFAPATVVKLLTGVPLDKTYINTRDFPNAAAQQAYFNSFVLQSFEQFTYQREKSVIRVPIPYETAVKANYCMYQNVNFSSKWFYAFVTSVEYVNPEMTAVSIETDVVQTWLFDYTVKPGFIERETPASDPLYGNTIPEGLEYGPIQIASESFSTGGDYYTVLAYFDGKNGQGGSVINNVFSGVEYEIYNTSDPTEVVSLNARLKEIDEAGLADNIVGMFLIPNFFRTPNVLSFNVPLSAGSVDGYTPRNKKVLGWPYRYLGIGWGMGQQNILRYELCGSISSLLIRFKAALNLEAQAFLWPANYAGLEDNYEEGVLMTDLPMCSWVSNAYANWVARNKWSNIATVVNGTIGLVSGGVKAIAEGDIGGALSGVGQAISLMGQWADRRNYPNALAGQAGASTIWASLQRIGVSVKKYEITAEYAKIIDQFFDRFGYKVTKVGAINTKSRTRWNYVKTAAISITGPIPADHLQMLQQIYDRGVTFWHDNNVGDYTAANGFAS